MDRTAKISITLDFPIDRLNNEISYKIYLSHKDKSGNTYYFRCFETTNLNPYALCSTADAALKAHEDAHGQENTIKTVWKSISQIYNTIYSDFYENRHTLKYALLIYGAGIGLGINIGRNIRKN